MRRREPLPMASALDQVLGERRPEGVLASVQSVWRRAVGDAVADEADPVAERDGIITVECRSSVWAAELDLMQASLAARLNALLDGAPVRGLRMRTGPVGQGRRRR